MQPKIFKAKDRGHFEIDWLNTYYTFSFADYYDPQKMQFAQLRVFNDDIIAASGGFPLHPHRNMEIITIPLEGSIEHRDSMGNATVLKTGEVQVMSAGSGIYHSEFNHSKSQELKLLQIWVLAEKNEIEPVYHQTSFDPNSRINTWQLLISPNKAENSLNINQQAYFSRTTLEKGKLITYEAKMKHSGIFVYLIEGNVEVSGYQFERRDGIGFSSVERLKLSALQNSDILVIESPM